VEEPQIAALDRREFSGLPDQAIHSLLKLGHVDVPQKVFATPIHGIAPTVSLEFWIPDPFFNGL
jgi:hypothetical protein